jgi:hypothetical protein
VKRIYRRLVTFTLLVMLLSMIDSMISSFMTPKELFRTVAGSREPISGKLVGNIIDIPGPGSLLGNTVRDPKVLEDHLIYEPQYPMLHLRFIELQGRLWRAWLETAAAAPPGTYPIHVFQRGNPPPKDAPAYVIQLFGDEHAYRNSFPSWIKRHLGIDPWWVSLGLLPVVLFFFAVSYVQAGKKDRALQAQGIGPIYKLVRSGGQWEVVFGLGWEHGIRPGDELTVCDRHLRCVGCLRATRVETDTAYASIGFDVPISADGYVVQRRDGADI